MPATLNLHTLRSPIAGTVDSLTCHPGQTLTVGTPVGEVVNQRRLLVTVYLPARNAKNVTPGLPVRIDVPEAESRDVPAGKSDEINGQVAFVGSVADPQTGNFPARILVDNGDARLRVGQLVKATIKLRTDQSAITVPQLAIFDEGEGPILAVVRDGKIKQLHPELGVAEGGFVAVRKTDLHDGDMVVVEGAYNVKDGTDATIEQAAAEGPAKPPPPGQARRPKPEPRNDGPASGSAALRSPNTSRGLNLVGAARPYFGVLVLGSLLLGALGVYAMLRMPSGIYPEVAFPRISVIAKTPGLAVKDIEISITRPVEEQVSIVLGVVRVRSKTVRGASELSIDFAPGTDMVQALNDVRARMAESVPSCRSERARSSSGKHPQSFPLFRSS